MIKCPKCSGPVRIMGQCTLSAPGELYAKFSKSNLRRKDVYLMGVNWETFDVLCQNPKCSHTINGYGNYVSRLQQENQAVKAREDALKSKLDKAREGLRFLYQQHGKIDGVDWEGIFPEGIMWGHRPNQHIGDQGVHGKANISEIAARKNGDCK